MRSTFSRYLLYPLGLLILTGIGFGCDSESISDLKADDSLILEFKKGDGSYSNFQTRVKTEAPYGCNARIAYRYTSNKSNILVFDIIGIETGNGNCDRSAVSQIETSQYTTQREFKIELRYQKKVTRYLITRNGAEWSDSLLISEIPGRVSFIDKDQTFED